jgi:cysteine synthase A
VPLIVECDPGLFALTFSSMKLLPAASILRAGHKSGRLTPGAAVVATSSGTFGFGLASVSVGLGHPCIVVSDPAIDPLFKTLLVELGAKVEIVGEPAASGGFQQARLDRVAELLEDCPGAFEADQYGDPANPAAYEYVGDLLRNSVGVPDILVGTVGSGGSLGGSAWTLRRENPDLLVVAVDTPGSVIFGCPDAPRLMRGLGNSLVPRNVDHCGIDEVHWVDEATAFAATLELFRHRGLFQGPTSGAAFAVARWHAEREPEARVSMILPDSGLRYLGSVYNRAWVASATQSSPSKDPIKVASPLCVQPDRWSTMPWRRRPLSAIQATAGEAA